MKFKVKSMEEISKTLDDDDYLLKRDNDCCWIPAMNSLCGTIIECSPKRNYRYSWIMKEGECMFVDEWLEPVEESPEWKNWIPGVTHVYVSNDGAEFGKTTRIWIGYIKDVHHCVNMVDESEFIEGSQYSVTIWKYAKEAIAKPKLTRKEIAEKFGISDDFEMED